MTAALTPCAREGCSIPCVGRTCSSRCRSILWKVETGYKDRRSVRNASQRRSAASLTRYAVVQISGSAIDVLALESARSRKAIRRLFGLDDHQDLDVVPARYLPAAVL